MLLILKSFQIYQAIRLLDEVLRKLKSFWNTISQLGRINKRFSSFLTTFGC